MTLTGLMVMMFSKTSNRKSVLVKVCGCFCLLSALLCVVVTVTTTVVHMNRLQTLRECVYQASTKTCTCFAGIMDHRSLDHDGRSPNNHMKDTEIDISSSKLIRNKAKVPYTRWEQYLV